MSNQLVITRVPGVPVSVLSDDRRAVIPVPDCPHSDCHEHFARYVAALEAIDADYDIEEYPLAYDEEPEKDSDLDKAMRRAKFLRTLLPVLADIKRSGADLAQYEQIADQALQASEQHDRGITTDSIIIVAPYSVN